MATVPLVLAIVIAGGMGLRAWRLASRNLWFDEASLYWVAKTPGWSDFLYQMRGMHDGPLFGTLLRAWLALDSAPGRNEGYLRLLPWILGALALVAVYGMARQFVGPRGALAATALLALSPVAVFYARELRPYALAMLLAPLCLYLTERFLRRDSWPNGLLWMLAAVAALYTHYGLFLLVGTTVLVLAARALAHPDGGRLTRLAILLAPIGAAVALLYFHLTQYQLAWGRTLPGYMPDQCFDLTRPGEAVEFLLRRGADLLQYPFLGCRDTDYGRLGRVLPVAAAVLLLVSLAAGQWIGRPASGRRALAYLLLPVAAAYLLSGLKIYRFGANRQMLFALPMLAVAIGAGLEWLLQRLRPVAWVLAAGLAGAAAVCLWRDTAADWAVQELHPVLQTLAGRLRHRDLLYVHHNAEPAFRYYQQAVALPAEVVLGSPLWGQPAAVAHEAADLARGRQRLWLITAFESKALDAAYSLLTRAWREEERIERQGARAILFVSRCPGFASGETAPARHVLFPRPEAGLGRSALLQWRR